MTSHAAESFKPDSAAVIRILDDVLPTIKELQKMNYKEADRVLQDEYFSKQWRDKKRKFGSLYLNLDYANQERLLKKIGVKVSKPEKENTEEIHTHKWYDKMAKRKYEYLPVEQIIIHNFCVYALNQSSYKGFSQDFINVKGWIKAWRIMSNNMKIEFANTLINYV